MTVIRSDKMRIELTQDEVDEYIGDGISIAWPKNLWVDVKTMLVKKTFMNINEDLEGSSYMSNKRGATMNLTIFRKEKI